MDPLVGLLDGPRARGAFVLRSIMNPPWSVRVQDEAPLSLVAMVRGDAWVVPDDDDDDAVHLGAGDVAITRGPDPYVFADDPGTPPQVVIHPGEHCTTPDGKDLAQTMDLGVRTWGNDPHGTTIMLIGTYLDPGEISHRLLHALPDLVVLRRDMWDSPLVPLLGVEIVKDEPGQEVVLDRLLDLLLIAVLRAWFSRPEAEAPAWYRGTAIRSSGARCACCRTTRSTRGPSRRWQPKPVCRAPRSPRRFTDLVGEPPMTFLTGWRIALAADLLREPDATIGAVAQQVGYGSPFALSTAFKRVRGVSPKEHRRAATASVPLRRARPRQRAQ